MRSILHISILFLFIPLATVAQEQVYFDFHANVGSEISVFPNGDFALAGSKNKFNDKEALLAYFDACGDSLWTRSLFEGLDFNRIIRIQNDGLSLWVAASLGPSRDTAIALIKMDRNGNVLLSKSITAPLEFVWYQFHLDRDGNLYFTGNSTSTTGSSNTILKLDPQGNIIHANQYSNIFIWGMSIPSPSGGILNTTGRTYYKVDGNGNVEWIKRMINFQQSSIPPIALSDGYLLFHQHIGAIDRTGIVKVDLQGNLLWSSDLIIMILPTAATLKSNGNVLMSYTNYGPSGVQWGIIEFNENGQIMRTDVLPLSTGDQVFAQDIKNLPDDRTLILGSIDFLTANYNALNFRWLPENLNDLQNCPTTPTTLPAQPTYISEDTIIPAFNLNPYFGFNIQNFNFPIKNMGLVENRFCGNDTNFSFDLGADTAICPSDTFYLKPNLPSSDYQFTWSTNSQADSILVEGPGLYWCEARSACGAELYRDSILISFRGQGDLEATMNPENLVPGDSIRLSSVINSEDILWRYGDTSVQGNPITIISDPTMASGIIASFVDSNGCVSQDTLFPTFADLQLFMPDAFTPNGDGLNDLFGPDPSRLDFYELQVFDRFGKQQALLQNKQWDGGDLKGGSYVYYLRYRLIPGGEERILRGIVNLIR